MKPAPAAIPFRVLLSLLLAGLITVPAAASTAAQCIVPGQWLRLADKQSVSNPQLLHTVKGRQVVLLGERHDNADHHRWQLQVLAGLYALRPDLVIGFEMFPRDVQPVLDQWVAGKLSEAELLKQSNWYGNWSFDPAIYMPLFNFARLNRIPMIALNIDRRLFEEVQEKGWDNVPAADREGVTDPAPPLKPYVEMLAGSFAQHHAGAHGQAERKPEDFTPEEKTAFRRFVQGQQLWDRAMAQKLAGAVQRDPAPLVVGILGGGHVMNGFGVPHQLAALGVKDTAVLVPWDEELGCEDLTPDFAYAVFGMAPTAAAEAEDKPRLGVYLEPHDKGVKVVKVVEHSVAESSGIAAGDVIVALAGSSVSNTSEVVSVVQRMVPGTWLPVSLLRDGKPVDVVAKFPVK
jgi:uncharacterized iron-regulated protein